MHAQVQGGRVGRHGVRLQQPSRPGVPENAAGGSRGSRPGGLVRCRALRVEWVREEQSVPGRRVHWLAAGGDGVQRTHQSVRHREAPLSGQVPVPLRRRGRALRGQGGFLGCGPRRAGRTHQRDTGHEHASGPLATVFFQRGRRRLCT